MVLKAQGYKRRWQRHSSDTCTLGVWDKWCFPVVAETLQAALHSQVWTVVHVPWAHCSRKATCALTQDNAHRWSPAVKKDFGKAQSWGNMCNHLWDQNWLKALPWQHPVCCQVLFRLRISLMSYPFVRSYEAHACEVQNSEASPGRLLITRSSTNSLFRADLVISVYLGPYPSALGTPSVDGSHLSYSSIVFM